MSYVVIRCPAAVDEAVRFRLQDEVHELRRLSNLVSIFLDEANDPDDLRFDELSYLLEIFEEKAPERLKQMESLLGKGPLVPPGGGFSTGGV